ncbi:unnamed protein product, partial [Owenia fusiformis]
HKQNASVNSTVTAFQEERSQGVIASVQKVASSENNSMNYNEVTKQGSPTINHQESDPVHPHQSKNIIEYVKVPMNQHWAESLQNLPQLLLIIILLLIIGGIEVNPGPQTQGKDSAKTATHFETSVLELLRSLLNSERINLNTSTPLGLIEDVVTKHGLTIVDNEGSGDCLFQALSHQLAYTKTANIDHIDLREKLVKYAKHHPLLPNGEHVTTQFDTTIIDDWTRYNASHLEINDDEKTKLAWYTESYMNKPGTWGDNLMIWAFTQLFDVDVEIFSQGSENSYKITANNNSDNKVIVRLGYIPHTHFLSLVSCKDKEISGGALPVEVHLSEPDALKDIEQHSETLKLDDTKEDKAAEIPKELEQMYNLGKKISDCDQTTQ